MDDLVRYFADKFKIEAPQLHEDRIVVDQQEAKRDVSGDPRRAFHHFHRGQGPLYATGTEIIMDVPFSGDPQMFKVKPSQWDTAPPRGIVKGNVITFCHWGDNLQADMVRREIDSWLASVNNYLQWQRQTFQNFNDQRAPEGRQEIERRRAKLLADKNLVSGLGIPLKRRPDHAKSFPAPEVRRKMAPVMPAATSGTYKPEPTLEEAEYQHILEILENMVHVMERSPGAFHAIDEEALRTLFLVSLNSHYEGQATGETFNLIREKTDILIRSDDRNIFIAECKFWGGPAMLTDTIDQLLGYLSWRDSKAAILVFNRNKDFSKVLAAIPGTVSAHPKLPEKRRQNGRNPVSLCLPAQGRCGKDHSCHRDGFRCASVKMMTILPADSALRLKVI